MALTTSQNVANGLNLGNSAVQGAFQIASMCIMKDSKMAAIKDQIAQAEKHYQHMSEIISNREETSNQCKEIRLNVLDNIKDLAEKEVKHAEAKERYKQAKITKHRVKLQRNKLREQMSQPFYGKPYRPIAA